MSKQDLSLERADPTVPSNELDYDEVGDIRQSIIAQIAQVRILR